MDIIPISDRKVDKNRAKARIYGFGEMPSSEVNIITDRENKPEITEICAFVNNPLFEEMLARIRADCKASLEIAYSGDKLLLGWNVRLYRSGRTLCRLYPREKHFFVLLVIGKRERERAEALMEQMSDEMRKIYFGTLEGMGQKWLIFDLCEHNRLYEELLGLISLRAN